MGKDLWGVGDGEDITEMMSGERPKRIRLTLKNPLVERPTQVQKSGSTTRPCANSGARKSEWSRVDSDWLKFKVDVSDKFMNSVGALCKGAKIFNCGNTKCRGLWEQVDQAAPECHWEFFRAWVVQAIACQVAMSKVRNGNAAHRHIASAISLFYLLLEEFNRDERTIERDLLGPGGSIAKIDVYEVVELIHWSLTVQYKMGYNQDIPNTWPDKLIPDRYVASAIKRAEEYMEGDFGLCKYRVHNLVNASVRRSAELPAIVEAAQKANLKHRGHKDCNNHSCYWKRKDLSKSSLAHAPKCNKNCERWIVAREKLRGPVMSGVAAIASLYNRDTILSPERHKYIAISHVWADGTGGWPEMEEKQVKALKDGRKIAERDDQYNEVNECYLFYFRRVAERLGKLAKPPVKINGVWWDALSNPRKWGKDGVDDKLRSRAMTNMHHNYNKAAYTVVHDKSLLDFTYLGRQDNYNACLAITLSAWFTRGWTALELHVSKAKNVYVLFGGKHEGIPVLARLDDIIPSHPALSLRAHWLSSLLINKVRKPIRNISDMLTLLYPRGTAWPEDMRRISALLVGWERHGQTEKEYAEKKFKESIEVKYTKGILLSKKKILNSALLHGYETIQENGPWSWCPKALKDMPASSTDDFDDGGAELKIHSDGSIKGDWYYRFLEAADTKKGVLTRYEQPILGRDLNERYEGYFETEGISNLAEDDDLTSNLEDNNWKNCLLLRHERNSNGPALLVATFGVETGEEHWETIFDCRYILAVNEVRPAKYRKDDLRYIYDTETIRLGRKEPKEDLNARDLFEDARASVIKDKAFRESVSGKLLYEL